MKKAKSMAFDGNNDIYHTALSALLDSSGKYGKGTLAEEQYEKSNISNEYSREFVVKSMILEHVNELFDD